MKHIFSLFIIFIIITTSSCLDSNKKARQSFIDSSYKGQITHLYNDKDNHNVWVIYIYTNNNDTISLFSHLFPGLLDYISIGDSLFKEKNTIELRVHKEDGSYKDFSRK